MAYRTVFVISAFWFPLIVFLSLATGTTAAFTFVDEMKRSIVFSAAPERIVVLTGYPAEVICAMGEGNRIVGIGNPENEFLPELRRKPSVGKSAVNPSLEKIFELSPDLVIAYQWTKKEIIEQLENWHIPVVCCRVWTMEELRSFVEQMGRLLGKEQEANEFWIFIHDKTSLIESKTRGLPEHEKPQIFMEVFNPYQSTPAGQSAMGTPWGTFMYQSPMQIQMEIAGGINCVGKQHTNSPRMSPEWVVDKNPDIFIKIPLSGAAGEGVSADSMKILRNEIMGRTEFKGFIPVQTGKVFIIHPRLCAGPRQMVGICYYANWFHPERFSNLNPHAVHEEMLKRFWDIELQGVWGYPEP